MILNRADFEQMFEKIGGLQPLLDELHPFDTASLTKLEKLVRVQLPSTYRDFLHHVGGISIPSGIVRMIASSPGSETTGEQTIDFLFGSDLERHLSIFKAIDGFRRDEASTDIPIGGDLFGNLMCLCVESSAFGQIFFWDHDSGGEFLAAKSFDDFISRLGVFDAKKQ